MTTPNTITYPSRDATNEVSSTRRVVSREALVAEHLPLVKAIAHKIAYRLPPHVELDDLISSGTLGLLDAVDKFDRNKCDNFKRYAEIRIKGAILDELRAMDHVSRTVRRQSNALNRAVTEAQAELGRQATAEELAARLGTDMRGYHNLVDKLKPILVMGFDELASGDDARDPMAMLADPEAIDPSEVLQAKKLRQIAAEHIDALKDRHRTVIRLYHYDALNLKEIGKVLGVTESRVSQLLSEALQTLRRRIRVAMSRDRVRAAQFG